MTAFTRFLLLGLIVVSTGCTKVVMVDDVEPDLAFFIPFVPPSNSMHTPYVIGATINVWAQSTDTNADMSEWSFESSNPDVFTVAPQPLPLGKGDQLNVSCVAQTAGSAVLTLKDGKGNVLSTETVEVKIPDNAVIMAHGPLMIGKSDAAATITQPQIEAGGTATFLVRWTAGGVELSGNGVLTGESTAMTIVPKTSEFLVLREWVELTAPGTAGPQTVSLSANGVHVIDLPVTVVAASDVANITLEGQSESGASKGTDLIVIAQAFDASSNPIFGVDYTFDIDGELQNGIGDLFQYQFDPTTPVTLTAHSGALSASATIHSGGGTVGSTNDVGCNSGGSGNALAALACACVFVAIRRRKITRG